MLQQAQAMRANILCVLFFAHRAKTRGMKKEQTSDEISPLPVGRQIGRDLIAVYAIMVD